MKQSKREEVKYIHKISLPTPFYVAAFHKDGIPNNTKRFHHIIFIGIDSFEYKIKDNQGEDSNNST